MILDRENKIKEKIEKTIGLLDNIETIEGNPFLYTRIKENIASPPERSRFRFVSALLSPRIALIITLLVINVLSVVFFLSKHSFTVVNDESFIVSLTDDYFLSANDDILNNLNKEE